MMLRCHDKQRHLWEKVMHDLWRYDTVQVSEPDRHNVSRRILEIACTWDADSFLQYMLAPRAISCYYFINNICVFGCLSAL